MTAPTQLTPAQASALAAGIVASTQAGSVTSAVGSVSQATAASIAGIAQATKKALHGLWVTTNPYSGQSVREFKAAANTILVAAQKSTAQTAAAGQSAMLRSIGVNVTVVPKLPDDVRVSHATEAVVSYSNGNDPATQVTVTPKDAENEALLERPARGFRWRESVGDSPEDAQRFSITRLDDVIDGNLVIAQRDAEHQVLNAKTRAGRVIIGYRRIIHPELSAGGVCGLCVAASDRVYKREALRPIHLRCKCTSAPVTAKYDPGQPLNSSDLARLYTDAGSTSAADLKRTRYTITYNELGPVLTPAAGETVPFFTAVNLDVPA